MGNIYSQYKPCPKEEEDNIHELRQIMIEKIGDCNLCEKKNINGYLVQSIIEDKRLFICDTCSGTIRH